jgi:hypothetical protein
MGKMTVKNVIDACDGCNTLIPEISFHPHSMGME